MARKHAIVAVVLLSAAPARAWPVPPPDHAVPPALLALRASLIEAGRERALAAVARYRPLCDADGYPLVGNLATKGDRYQPSAFCRDVRQRAGRA